MAIGEVSIPDTQTLVEAARLKLGRQTHDVAFTPDGRTLFVAPRPIVIGTLNVPPRPHGLVALVRSS